MCIFRSQNKSTWSLSGFPELPYHRVDDPEYHVTQSCPWLLCHSDLYGGGLRELTINQPAQEGRIGWHMAEKKKSDNSRWLIQTLENKKSIHSHLQYFNLKNLPKSCRNIICMKAHIAKKDFQFSRMISQTSRLLCLLLSTDHFPNFGA